MPLYKHAWSVISKLGPLAPSTLCRDLTHTWSRQNEQPTLQNKQRDDETQSLVSLVRVTYELTGNTTNTVKSEAIGVDGVRVAHNVVVDR